MRCPNCGNKISEGWRFCPICGFQLERERSFIDDVFERMERVMREMNKEMERAFERNFEAIDLSPFFTKPLKSSGFSIKITHKSGEKPKISIKTYGDVDQKEIEKEIEKLGFKESVKKIPIATELERVKEKSMCLEGAKTTEEPETCVKRIGDKILAEVKLPGVKSEKDIEVRVLENSIEVKAIAGDKAYFKILTKPPNTNIAKQVFRNGILTLEFV
jgi:HSP20 family molecular chaperone IbpA